MIDIPMHAQHLYAWAVEYCQRKDISLSRIKINWKKDKYVYWMGEDKEWSLHLTTVFPSFWPVGFSLVFDNELEPEAYGLRSLEREGIHIVPIQPGHKAFESSQGIVRCEKCNIVVLQIDIGSKPIRPCYTPHRMRSNWTKKADSCDYSCARCGKSSSYDADLGPCQFHFNE